MSVARPNTHFQTAICRYERYLLMSSSCPKEMSTVVLLSASYRMLPTTVLVIMGSQLRRVLVTGSLPIHLSILAIYRLVK